MNLNQITLPSRNVAESIAFFLRMGFMQIVDAPHYARFECPSGDATFSVHEAKELAENSGVVVYFETDDLDGIVKRLEDEGLGFYQQPRDEPWLWREARLKDPSGNIICLYLAGSTRPVKIENIHHGGQEPNRALHNVTRSADDHVMLVSNDNRAGPRRVRKTAPQAGGRPA
jgi:catechol 2,3-dioxygenase-like lactoylglutathione lyase family enzyme